ncbi:hypothetical protein M8J76_011810 [Diaphorina citri]|nr:hypothetical protein M8J76_011810 [Diaphorina citri]
MACLILVPPYAMSVYNKQGEVKDSVIGPLEEGIGLTLSCEVRGDQMLATPMSLQLSIRLFTRSKPCYLLIEKTEENRVEQLRS